MSMRHLLLRGHDLLGSLDRQLGKGSSEGHFH